jgi:hypothetical protein
MTPSAPDEHGTPRWVKAFGIIAVLFVIAFAALHLTGRGFGPGMHGHGANHDEHVVDAGAPP